MVLVRVGQHQAQDVATLFEQVTDIREDEIDAGQLFFAGKGNAAIDDQSLAPAFVAEPVDREIHPDLANAAKRREHELGAGH